MWLHADENGISCCNENRMGGLVDVHIQEIYYEFDNLLLKKNYTENIGIWKDST